MEFRFDDEFCKLNREYKTSNVYVMGHINPDGDCVGSVMGLAHYIRQTYPQMNVAPYLDKVSEKGCNHLLKDEKIFAYNDLADFKGDAYGIIACDDATLVRLKGNQMLAGASWVMAIDHHASHETYESCGIVRIEESCCELIVSLLSQEALRNCHLKMSETQSTNPSAAEYFYLGILHDTDSFKRANARTLQIASGLLNMGVDHAKISRTLRMATYADYQREAALIESAYRCYEGRIAYVMVDQDRVKKEKITYDEIHPIGARLRDFDDIIVGFTMYEEEEGRWRCSFRSEAKLLDVDKLLRPYGGGGHAGASGLRIYHKDGYALKDAILNDMIKALNQKIL